MREVASQTLDEIGKRDCFEGLKTGIDLEYPEILISSRRAKTLLLSLQSWQLLDTCSKTGMLPSAPTDHDERLLSLMLPLLLLCRSLDACRAHFVAPQSALILFAGGKKMSSTD